MAAKKKTASILDQTPPVTVEYDYGTTGDRRQKTFDDAHEAKTFYVAKEKAGKNPKVLAAGKEAKPATAAAAPAKATAPGVRAGRTRPYLAGTIIAKYGLAAGVTDEMVAELDELYQKPNATESRFVLKNAWHVVRAFTGVAEDATT